MGKTLASKSKNQKLEEVEEFLDFTDAAGIERRLTFKEELFCKAYLENRGIGVEAIYTAGYDVETRHNAAVMASEMLRKSHIVAYINYRLADYGYNDDNVDLEHLYLIKQYSDLNAKARGIDMYRKMKGQYAATKHIFSDDNDDLTDEELEQEIARRKATGKPREDSEVEEEE